MMASFGFRLGLNDAIFFINQINRKFWRDGRCPTLEYLTAPPRRAGQVNYLFFN